MNAFKGILIKNGEVYIDHKFVKKNILVMNGKIFLDDDVADEDNLKVIDASQKRILPGFIDIHTHGAYGVDVNDASAEDFEKICEQNVKHGVTAWLCSVLTDSKEQTIKCINEVKRYKKMSHNGSTLYGIHLEGPFLSPEYKGAMPEYLLQEPNFKLIKMYQDIAEGDIKYITISPELSNAVEVIPEMIREGIVVAIGHSGADYDTAWRAIKNGAASCTHTFNALKLPHQHFPAIAGAVLESDIYCEAICDGLHLHPGIIRLLLKTKGLDKVVAITDSIMATGLEDGDYKLGVNDIVVKNGDAQLKDGGGRAGSTLTLDRALNNLLKFTNYTLEELIPLFTENPAKLLGIYNQKGSIADNKDADLLIMDDQNRIENVIVNGKQII